MDVQLDLAMRTAGVLEAWSLCDYQKEYQCVPQTLSDGREARLIDGGSWYKDNQYYHYEDQIVVPEAWLAATCSGPISIQGTEALTALLTSSGSLSTPDEIGLNYSR